MRKKLTQTPKRYDEINHITLRSDLENELLLGSYVRRAEPGQDSDIIFEDEDGTNQIVFNYKYSLREYLEDCKILGL